MVETPLPCQIDSSDGCLKLTEVNVHGFLATLQPGHILHHITVNFQSCSQGQAASIHPQHSLALVTYTPTSLGRISFQCQSRCDLLNLRHCCLTYQVIPANTIMCCTLLQVPTGHLQPATNRQMAHPFTNQLVHLMSSERSTANLWEDSIPLPA